MSFAVLVLQHDHRHPRHPQNPVPQIRTFPVALRDTSSHAATQPSWVAAAQDHGRFAMRRFTVTLALAIVVLLSLAPSSLQTRAQEATPALIPNAPGATLALNGADFYYEVYGAGDPVVFVHGGGGSGRNFVNQIPAFVDAGYQVIVIDSRGHGHSSHGPNPLSYELMASDVLGVMDHLGIAQADLVGWSDGGIIGLELGITHPERLHKVVAYGANYNPEGLITEGTPTPEFDAFIGPFFDQLVADYEQTSPTPGGFDALFAEVNALSQVAPNFSEDQLRSIRVPFLILAGAEEELIKPEHTRRLAELIPGAELIFMPGTGHFAPIQQPEDFNRIVLAYLASPDAAATPAP